MPIKELLTWQDTKDISPKENIIPSPCNLGKEMKEEGIKIEMPENWHPPLIDGNWEGKSFISVEQLTEKDMTAILNSAAAIINTRTGGLVREKTMLAKWLYPDTEMLTAFYETSTRTRDSFEVAVQLLGGSFVSNPDMVKLSSAYKGESVADNAKVMACYAPLIVQRHPHLGAAAIAAYAIKDFMRIDGKKAQIINAGDGAGEHPTQALLDVATIVWEKELKNKDNLKHLRIGMLGDLKNGRTVHSLTKLLTLLGGPKEFFFISPKELAMPKDVLDHSLTKGQNITVTENLEGALPVLDVLYITRIQKERFEDPMVYEKLKGKYIVTPKTLIMAKKELTIMHPLPRVDEIHPSVDNDPRAAYFRQVEYGLYVRMALLCQMVGRPYPGNNH